MDKNLKNSTNDDILKGNGLKPIPSPQTSIVQPGITVEKRGEDIPGIRIERFTKDSINDSDKKESK